MTQFANDFETTLAASLTKSATTLKVASAAKAPAVPFTIRIDDEWFNVTEKSGTTFTVERGIEGSEAVAHSSGASVFGVVTAGFLNSVVTESKGDLRYAKFDAVRRNLAGTSPSFTKNANNPIITFPTTDFTENGQWPWIVNVVKETGAVGATYGETYRIYYSTDHEEETAKIGVLTCANRAALEAGEWTDRGEIFADPDQSETPAVIWDPATEKWFMYYHKVGVEETTSGEVTLLATSADGLSEWTKKGVVLDTPADDSAAYPTSDSWGYFRPFRIGERWFAHSLLSGTSYGRFGLCYSEDGETWAIDPRPLGYESQYTGSSKRIEWNSGTVIYWNGQLWWIGFISNFTSGGGERETEYVAAPISTDFRKLLAPPTTLFSSLQEWETSPADNRSGGSVLADTNGALVLAYSGGEKKFGIAVGV